MEFQPHLPLSSPPLRSARVRQCDLPGGVVTSAVEQTNATCKCVVVVPPFVTSVFTCKALEAKVHLHHMAKGVPFAAETERPS